MSAFHAINSELLKSPTSIVRLPFALMPYLMPSAESSAKFVFELKPSAPSAPPALVSIAYPSFR